MLYFVIINLLPDLFLVFLTSQLKKKCQTVSSVVSLVQAVWEIWRLWSGVHIHIDNKIKHDTLKKLPRNESFL